jgi:hypothetical protein
VHPFSGFYIQRMPCIFLGHEDIQDCYCRSNDGRGVRFSGLVSGRRRVVQFETTFFDVNGHLCFGPWSFESFVIKLPGYTLIGPLDFSTIYRMVLIL